jgi:transposase
MAIPATPPVDGSYATEPLGLFLSMITTGILHLARMVDRTQGSYRKEGQAKMAQTSMIVAGIDTGKAKLDTALSSGRESLQVDNSATGHTELATWLEGHGVTRIGIEASGGYEAAVIAHLRAQSIGVTCFQPAQVRAYATYRLQRAKNDKIDARMIAQCTLDATPSPVADPRLSALAEPLTYLEQVEEDLARAKTRLEAFRQERQRALVTTEIKRLKDCRKAAIKALVTALHEHKDLARRLALIQSVDGIGERTALALIVRMPELGSITREQAASLAGLAPFDHESGKVRRSRHIFGGRDRLRKSLYAAALPAAFQWNEALIALYKRLTSAGKPHKLAMIACARKLLIFANTVVARGTPWQTKIISC